MHLNGGNRKCAGISIVLRMSMPERIQLNLFWKLFPLRYISIQWNWWIWSNNSARQVRWARELARFLNRYHAQHDYSYAGLRPALMVANQYDTDINNDVPVVYDAAVQVEHQVIGGHYVPSAGGKRAPSRDEIFAMGNVSLAYGVKGFMYYMVPNPLWVKGYWHNLGDLWTFWWGGKWVEFGNPIRGWVQDAGNKQIPNGRFTVVKDFISSLKPVETTLLGLTWQDAKSWNTTTSCSVNWITNLSSRYPHFGEDEEASKTTMKIDAEWMPPSQGNFTSGGQSNLLRVA